MFLDLALNEREELKEVDGCRKRFAGFQFWLSGAVLFEGNDRQRPLVDFSIAPYYGCQALRPYVVFDDPEAPTSMEPVLEAAGAKIHPWDMGGRCCGASNMTTKPEVALDLVAAILQDAKGADAIVTVCPMCQMNLEAYQKKVSGMVNEDLSIPILYLPQFLGLAIGLSEKDLHLDDNLSDLSAFRKKLQS